MKKITKRILSLLLCAAMVASLAACSSGDSQDNSGNNSSSKSNNNSSASVSQIGTVEENKDYSMERYDDEVVITRGYESDKINWIHPGDTDEDNVWTRYWKDTYNIKVENKFEIPASEYSQKIDLAIASGNLPDMFHVTPAQLKQCVELGLLADLTEVYEKYASADLKTSENNYRAGFESGIFDGKLYAISDQYFGDVANMLNIWYRSDWAEKLGISKPTTLQEFKDMCIAFRDQDPDGNGKNDTLALAIDNNLGNAVYSLMYAFGAYPNIWIEKEDGTIEFGGIQPEAKLALAELNDWYNQGIIDKDWATSSRNQMKEGITSGTAGCCLYGSHIGYSLGVSIVQNNPNARLLPVAIPSATDEPIYYAVSFPVGQYTVVSADCKHPEAVIKLLNGYSYFSEHGTVEEIDEYVGPAGFVAPCRVNNPNADLSQHISIALAETTGDTSTMKPDAANKYAGVLLWKNNLDPNGYGDYLQQSLEGGYAQLRPIVESDHVITDMLRGPQTETMAANWSSLKTIMDEVYTQIICGQKPIEFFDEFVTKWKALGGDQITIEMNEAYGK